jgi:hypothetical protein
MDQDGLFMWNNLACQFTVDHAIVLVGSVRQSVTWRGRPAP